MASRARGEHAGCARANPLSCMGALAPCSNGCTGSSGGSSGGLVAVVHDGGALTLAALRCHAAGTMGTQFERSSAQRRAPLGLRLVCVIAAFASVSSLGRAEDDLVRAGKGATRNSNAGAPGRGPPRLVPPHVAAGARDVPLPNPPLRPGAHSGVAFPPARTRVPGRPPNLALMQLRSAAAPTKASQRRIFWPLSLCSTAEQPAAGPAAPAGAGDAPRDGRGAHRRHQALHRRRCLRLADDPAVLRFEHGRACVRWGRLHFATRPHAALPPHLTWSCRACV